MKFTWNSTTINDGVLTVIIREASSDDYYIFIHDSFKDAIAEIRLFDGIKVKITYCPKLVEKLKIKNNLKKFLK